MTIKIINASQIREISAKGITYTEDDDSEGFIDFEVCSVSLKELLYHPNVKAMNQLSRFAEEYAELSEQLKTGRVIGYLSEHESNIPWISLVNATEDVSLKFKTYEEYVSTRDVIHRHGWKFIRRMFEIF